MEDAQIDMANVTDAGDSVFQSNTGDDSDAADAGAKRPSRKRKPKARREAAPESASAASPSPVVDEPAPQEEMPDAEAATGRPKNAPPREPVADAVFEALLFASDAPVSLRRLADLSACPGPREVEEAITRLNEKYHTMGCAFRIEKLAGGYQLLTTPQYHEVVTRLEKQRAQNRLGDAALETLAIIAYRQPIIRADIEAIRGVACGEVLTRLREAGLIRIAGRAEVVGRPLLYATTRKFLDTFGLGGLEDLPASDGLSLPPRPTIRPDASDDLPRAQSA